jgi:hypothetical protein
MITDVLTLLSEGFRPRDVFCSVRSIGMREFYQANATDFHPEVKFVLADYLDYAGETMAIHDGQLYRILRTYRTGIELELTAEKAAAEDGDLYG